MGVHQASLPGEFPEVSDSAPDGLALMRRESSGWIHVVSSTRKDATVWPGKGAAGTTKGAKGRPKLS